MGPNLIDWCHERRKFGHRHVQREESGKTEGEDSIYKQKGPQTKPGLLAP